MPPRRARLRRSSSPPRRRRRRSRSTARPRASSPKGSFPAADPVFILESLATDGKSAQISVAGGSYSDGKQTIKLQIGKKLTLQNTSDGSRYDLELLTVAGFVPPKK